MQRSRLGDETRSRGLSATYRLAVPERVSSSESVRGAEVRHRTEVSISAAVEMPNRESLYFLLSFFCHHGSLFFGSCFSRSALRSPIAVDEAKGTLHGGFVSFFFWAVPVRLDYVLCLLSRAVVRDNLVSDTLCGLRVTRVARRRTISIYLPSCTRFRMNLAVVQLRNKFYAVDNSGSS